jgi:DinB superfamily
MIQSREEIAAAMSANFTAFAGYVAVCDETSFTQMPEGKWSAGQHLEHLIRSSQPVYMAIGLPAFLLKLIFGKPNRNGRNFDGLVLRYKEKLSLGGAASGRFVPPAVPYSLQQQKVKLFLQLKDTLQKRVLALSDNKLDNCLLPHPLLGKISVREMLFFTVYHTQHHLQIMQKQTGK